MEVRSVRSGELLMTKGGLCVALAFAILLTGCLPPPGVVTPTPTNTTSVTLTPTATALSQSPCVARAPIVTLTPPATFTPVVNNAPGPDLTPIAPVTTLAPTLEPPPLPYETPVPIPTTNTQQPKHLRITIYMRECIIAVEAMYMDYGRARSYVGDPDQFRTKLIGFSGELLGEIRTWDPRTSAVYQTDPSGTLTDPFDIKQEIMADLVIPFIDGLASLEFLDRWKYVYAGVDLVPTIQAFCTINKSDNECSVWLNNVNHIPTPTP